MTASIQSARARRGGLTLTRRQFVQLGAAVLAAGGLPALGPLSMQAQNDHDGVDALVLSCIDFRLVDDVTRLMDSRGQTNRYDQVMLAGATLAPATDRFPPWNSTFWEHLDVAIQLHQVGAVVAIDHRDCGAYRLAFGKDFGQVPDEETAIHAEIMGSFARLVRERHPDLQVETWLMALDGSVESI